jgi:hypothetical protein
MQPYTVSIVISMCMFYSSRPSLSLSSPYSKNAGVEFVSKIDLAILYVYTMYTQLQSQLQLQSQTTQYNGKVPDICIAYVVYIKCTLMYCDFFLKCWSTSISQSLAEQTQALSNKHHVSFIATYIYYLLHVFILLFQSS